MKVTFSPNEDYDKRPIQLALNSREAPSLPIKPRRKEITRGDFFERLAIYLETSVLHHRRELKIRESIRESFLYRFFDCTTELTEAHQSASIPSEILVIPGAVWAAIGIFFDDNEFEWRFLFNTGNNSFEEESCALTVLKNGDLMGKGVYFPASAAPYPLYLSNSFESVISSADKWHPVRWVGKLNWVLRKDKNSPLTGLLQCGDPLTMTLAHQLREDLLRIRQSICPYNAFWQWEKLDLPEVIPNVLRNQLSSLSFPSHPLGELFNNSKKTVHFLAGQIKTVLSE